MENEGSMKLVWTTVDNRKSLWTAMSFVMSIQVLFTCHWIATCYEIYSKYWGEKFMK